MPNYVRDISVFVVLHRSICYTGSTTVMRTLTKNFDNLKFIVSIYNVTIISRLQQHVLFQ
jgi:hypothetical protein